MKKKKKKIYIKKPIQKEHVEKQTPVDLIMPPKENLDTGRFTILPYNPSQIF